MKRNLQILKMLLMTVILICSAQSSWADDCLHKNGYPLADYPNQNWVDSLVKVAPDLLLRDMSIVRSHDAGTWSGTDYNYKDQSYCERDLFKKGVRAFDMRLITRIDSDSVKFKFSHGGDQSFAGYDAWEDFNTFDDEINNHFPTKEDIEKEFLIIFFKWEGHDEETIDQDRRRAALLEFVKKIADKYGKENIIRFKKDLTVKEMQGKVLLITSVYHDVIRQMYTYPFTTEPLKTIFENKDYSDYTDVPITIQDGCLYDLKNKASSLEKFNSYGDYSATRINKKESVKNHLYSWFNKIKNGNIQNEYHFVTVNSYYFEHPAVFITAAVIAPYLYFFNLSSNPNTQFTHQNGWEICSDYEDDPGVNHVTYDVLNRWYLPFGIISYDFCGTESVKSRKTFGNTLLDLCVENNFRMLPKTNPKPFIKEICVARGSDRQTIQTTMLDKGFTYIDLQANQGIGSELVYIGYKTTYNYEESVSDVIVVYDASPAEEITIGNKTYYRATAFGNNWSGNVIQDKKDGLYVYYSKNDANSSGNEPALTVLDLRQNNIRPGADHLANLYYKSEEEYKFSGTIARLNESTENSVYLTYSLHKHEYYLDGNDSQRHRECCTLCPKVKSIKLHNFVYTPNVYGKHINSCV